MAIKSVKEILGNDLYSSYINEGKSATEIKDLAKVERKKQLANKDTTQTKVNPKSENEFVKYVNEDRLGSSFIRAGATTAGRLVAAADYVSEKVGFNLVDDSTTTKMNNVLDSLEEIKQKHSQKNVTPERLEEIQQAQIEASEATGVKENIIAGAKQMVDVATHPREWTAQGAFEMLVDPINLISFGTGGVVAKFARTVLGKVAIGSSVGALEGGVTNALSEYVIAKGLNKSDEESEKIAFQSFGGGVAAGTAFGGVGAGTSAFGLKITKEKTDHSNILENDLLKEDSTPLSDDDIAKKFSDAFRSYDKIEIEKAGRGFEDYKPDFRVVFNNLPVVRATRETLPAIIRELVEGEIIEPNAVKQIENKTLKMIGHKDIIYANLKGWAENIGQHIVDAINAKKINDLAAASKDSTNAVENSKLLAAELNQAGANVQYIKDSINAQLKPTKKELIISNAINDGKPLENRFTGTRLRDLTLNTIGVNAKHPKQLQADLEAAGVVNDLNTAIVQSYINKDIEVFDNFVAEKLSANIKTLSEQNKNNIVARLTHQSETDININNKIKEITNVTNNKRSDRQSDANGEQNGDHVSDEQSRSNNQQQEPGKQKSSESNDPTLHNSDGTDIGNDSSTNEISNKSKSMDGFETPGRDDATISKSGSDKMVQDENRTPNDAVNLDLTNAADVELTKGQRVKVNDQVHEIIKKPIEDITLEDKEVLRRYTGNGGISKSGEGMLTEHYTPYSTIKAMYKSISNIKGFNPKDALDPSVGAGNFVGFNSKLNWTTVDIDKTNHEVVKRLYPDAKHYLNSFEDYKGKDFDLIISNVPFVEVRGESSLTNRPDVKALHDYYFVSSLDKVKDNGVIAYITSKGVMDKLSSKIRAEIVSKADVIGAYRLPGTTFKKNTHTEVVSDIIFLQKRPDGAKSRLAADNEAFVKSAKTSDDIALNSYYKKYPTKVLGSMKAGINKQYGTKAYEVTGTADYSSMKLDYKKYDNVEVSNKSKTKVDSEMPTSEAEFREYASKNEIHYSYEGNNFIKTDDGFKILDKKLTFDDVEATVKIYKNLSGKTLEKIELLNTINDTKDAALVKQYQKDYKTHPLKDRSLSKTFRAADSMETLYEYGALFDKDFNLSDAFESNTKFKNSGKLEIDENSKLHDRLLSNENEKGEIDLSTANHLDRSELQDIFKLGYALSSKDKLVNNALYYAGNIYKKLDDAALLKDKVPGTLKKQITSQLEKLQKALPKQKIVDEIEFKGTENWLVNNGIKLFDYEIKEKWVNLPNGDGKKRTTEVVSKMGYTYNKFLNSNALIKEENGESQSKYKRRLKDAQFKIKEIQQEIKNKIKRDPSLKEQVEDAYNRAFNFYTKPDYKKLRYLVQDTLNELPPKIKLRDNQIDWVVKALVEGKNINAHDVGGGKTMAGIFLARVLKNKGVAKKPLIVVPSKVIKNWEKEIKLLFPDAKIINLGSIGKTVREKRLFDLGNAQADYVLISQEGFKQLKLPGNIEQEYARDLMSENLRNDDLKGRAYETQAKKIQKYLKVLSNENANKKITIDKLGIDAIIADEARAFKNVGVSSKLVGNKLGKAFTLKINEKNKVSLDSARSYDFRFKTKYISSLNNNRNIFLLDATPTPNKPIELFTMLKHLDDTILEEYGIKTDRDFAEQFFNFGRRATKKGTFENGLIGIKNAFALRSIIDRFVDRIPMSQFAKRKLIVLPEAETVKEMIAASDESIEVFENIAKRLQEAKSDFSKRKDIMGIFSNGVTASVDPRLYNHTNFDILVDATPENSKIEKVVKTVAATFKKNKEAGQIIFLDNAGHSAINLSKNLHQEIKDKLIKQGYKKEQIAIISGQQITNSNGIEVKATGEKASKMKQDIVDAYAKGIIKVVIGTTKSAGEGMNIQKYTTNIHHIDMPWTLAEIIQRNGRGLRHGNQNSKIKLHYYFQEGTFDSLMYSTVMGKKGWNEAIWDSKAKDYIEITDDEGGAMPSEVEILIEMERDPVKKQIMITQLKHEKLFDEEESIKDESLYLNNKLMSVKENINSNLQVIKKIEDDRLNDAPTETIRGLMTAIAKSKSKKTAKTKYEEALSVFREKREMFRTSRLQKNEDFTTTLKQLEKEKELNDQDLKQIDQDLKDFDAKNFDERGNIKTALDKDC